MNAEQTTFFDEIKAPREFEVRLSPEHEYDQKLIIALSDVLIEFMQRTGKSLTDISKGTGVAISTLSDWAYGKSKKNGSAYFQNYIRLDWRIFQVMRFIGGNLEQVVLGIGEIPNTRSELLKQFEALEAIDFAKNILKKYAHVLNELEFKKAQRLGIVEKKEIKS